MRISDWSSDVCSSDLDRVTGRLDEFSPRSKKIHVDIDASSINKNVMVDLAIVGDAGSVLEDLLAAWQARKLQRSEEHTSELQSLMRISYAVFCLKKKNNNHRPNNYYKNAQKKQSTL